MTERRLDIKAKLRGPLLLGTDRESTFYNETRDYIPGGAVRGALAEIMLGADAQQDFVTLFGPDASSPIFENLYPTPSGALTYPLPLSARTCKYLGGFTTEEKGEHHGMGDILIRQAVFEALLETGVPLPALYEPLCPTCHRQVKPELGFYGMTPLHDGRTLAYDKAIAPVRRTSRTAINRQRGTSAERMLYTLGTILPDDKLDSLRGSIGCSDQQEAILQQWLPNVEWIGKGRSRGLGHITLEIVDEPDPGLPPLPTRVERFDAAVRDEWRFYERVANAEPLAEDVHFFAVDLVAPALLTRAGLPATRPDLKEWGLPGETAQIFRAFTRQGTVGGWHMGGRLPRRTALVTNMGSVFMVQVNGSSLNDLKDSLQKLENDGLGEERERGFGRVLISSPIHYQPEVIL